MKVIRSIATITLAILNLIVFTLLTIIASVFQPYRLVVWLVAKYLDNSTVGFAGGMNSLFLLGSDDKPWLNLVGYLIVDGKISVESLRSSFTEKIFQTDEFTGLRRYFTQFMGYTLVKNSKNFSLSNHIRSYDYQEDLFLPSPFTEDDLQRVSPGLVAAAWRKQESPWEILIAPNFHYFRDDKPKTALILRFNHGLADGFSCLKLVYKLFNGEDVIVSGPPSKISFWERILLFPCKMFYDLAEQQIDSFSAKCAWTLGLDQSLECYTTIMKDIPMDTIKKIKNKYGVNYNAILMAGLSGGIHAIMKEAGQDVPEYLTCFIPLPRSNHPGGMTNHMDCSRIALRIGSPNPYSIKAIDEEMRKTKQSLCRISMRYLLYLGGTMPKFVSRFILSNDFNHTIVGNVPISNGHYSVEGWSLVDSIVIMANTSGFLPPGVAVTMGGVGGKQRICATINKSLFPSQELFQHLGGYIREEILRMLHD